MKEGKSFMSQNDSLSKITKIVAQQIKKPENELVPATKLSDLGADEFDMIEIVMKLEDQFGVIIDDTDVAQLESIEAVNRYISSKK